MSMRQKHQNLDKSGQLLCKFPSLPLALPLYVLSDDVSLSADILNENLAYVTEWANK